MQRRSILFAALVVTICVVGVVVPTNAHQGYSSASLKGRWAFVEKYHSGGAPGTAVGSFVFDGAGGCSYSGTEHGWIYTKPTAVTGECTYSISKSGLGEITGAPMVDVSFVVTEHGRALRYIFTGEKGYFGHGQMAPSSGRVSEETVLGRWSFIEDYQIGDAYGSAVGQVRFDSGGECAERWVEHGGAASYGPSGPGSRWVSCNYTVDKHGHGVITGGFVDQHFVVAEAGQKMFFIDGDENWPGYYGHGEMNRS